MLYRAKNTIPLPLPLKFVCFIFEKYFWLLVFVFIYSCQYSENCDNLKKIDNGINVKEVLDIMKNEPDSILIIFFESSSFTYMYKAPYGASDNVYINFSDKDSIVLSAHGCE